MATKSSKKFTETFSISLSEDSRIEMMPDGSAAVHGCKLDGNRSLNKVFYPDAVLDAATPLYRGVRVFQDHSDDPGGWGFGPRSRRSIMGWIGEDVMFAPGGHRGTFHVLPSWVKKGFVEDMKVNPKLFGFSHVIYCETADKLSDEGYEVVTKILSVESVDLVAEPATTRGMFENVNKNKEIHMDSTKEASDKLVTMLESKLTMKEAEIATITAERDRMKAEAAGATATINDLKVKLQKSEDAATKAGDEIRAAKVDAALVGMSEEVAKTLREYLKPLTLDAALAVIESTKKLQPLGPGAPKSEGKSAESKKGESNSNVPITDEEFASAFK